MLKQNTNSKTKGQKPVARLVAYRRYQDSQGNDKSHQVEIGAAWPTGNGNGYALSFKVTPLELLSGDCQLYIFPVEDKAQEQ